MAKQTFTTGQVLTAAQMTALQQTAMLGGAANAKTASYVLVAADAGDAITMSNAGSTTITANTGLFAAGDIVTIINLGAGVCTITAGTATVSTSGSLALAQNQGGVLRFTSASAAIFFQFATPASGDIEGVTAGTGISGGGTSGTVTITNSMATEITAKGDLIVGTGSATFDNLAAGSNGETLVADSSTSTGLRYTAGTVQANPVLNSAMQVWQRGTSIALAASTGYTSGFVADRYQTGTGANQACTVSRQTTSDTTNLPFIQYGLRYQRNSGQTGTGALYLVQSFESINSVPFAGKTVTFSFYARAGANYSATSNALAVVLRSGTGTDQNLITAGYTGSADVVNQTATLTTTWQRFTYTGSVGATATELGFLFGFTPTGTAGANDYYDITGIQIDIGSVALPFRTYAATIQGELAACQRYYWRNVATAAYAPLTNLGWTYSSSNGNFLVNFPVRMRIAPTSLDYGGSIQLLDVAGGQTAITSLASGNATPLQTDITLTASGLTSGRVGWIRGNNDAASYIGFSAEL